jgi:hypothetical protein
MVLGTVDVGRAYALKNRLTNMARQGAFQAQYYPGMVGAPTCTGVTSIVRAALAEDTDLRNATVTVTNLTSGSSVTGCSAPPNAPPSGTRLRVTVTGPMAVLTPLAAAWTGSTARITGYEDVVVQ